MDYIALPKIELHAHLTGSVSRQTLHEIWKLKHAAGETTLEDPQLVMPDGKHDYNLKTFFPLFSSYIYNLLTDRTSIMHATTFVLRDFEADGIVYLELRTTPRPTPHLTMEEYVSAIVDAIAAFPTTTMHTKLILCVDRRHDVATAEKILSLCGGEVVGLDLCGDPTAKPGGEIDVFTGVFKAAKQRGLGVTVHFAEAEASGSQRETEVLLGWEPGRLGHVIWEGEGAKKVIEERGLCLELCLSCNVLAGMVDGEFGGHHFGYWRERGVMIALSTDDVGVFGSPLSNEYRLVGEHFNLTRQEICDTARSCIDGIFGGEDEKKRLRDIMWK